MAESPKQPSRGSTPGEPIDAQALEDLLHTLKNGLWAIQAGVESLGELKEQENEAMFAHVHAMLLRQVKALRQIVKDVDLPETSSKRKAI